MIPDPSKFEPFRPAWWCPGAHAQTILGRFLRPVPEISLRRKRFETADGDFLDLDEMPAEKGSPTVLILTGLEGSSQAPYVLSVLGEIRRKGWRGAVMNFRSCSVKDPDRMKMNFGSAGQWETNRLVTSYHSGKTDDLDFVVRYFLETEKVETLFLIGYSIGGNVLLKWLGEKGPAVPSQVHRAAAVAVPYDLVKSVELLDQGFNRNVYTRALLLTLKAKALEKESLFPGCIDKEKVRKAATFKVFDGEVTARLHGFRDAMDYWIRSSSLPYLDQIRIPTLLIHAADDPFFPGSFFPFEIVEKSPYLEGLVTQNGGHLGFLSGPTPWKQDLWLERTILSFLNASS